MNIRERLEYIANDKYSYTWKCYPIDSFNGIQEAITEHNKYALQRL